MNTMLKALNQEIVEKSVKLLATAATDRLTEREVIRYIADIVECSGGTIDACSRCGSMPMTANCNNAGCDV